MLHRLIKEVAPTEAGAFERGGYEKAIMLEYQKQQYISFQPLPSA